MHYGWRAHADMAYFLVGQRPADDAPDEQWHAFQHRALAALEEVFLLVDQLYRLVRAVRSHLRGENFLRAYAEHVPEMHVAYAELAKLSDDEWAEILPLPESGTLVNRLGDMGAPGDLAAEMLELARALHALCVKNMQEITVFFERVPSPVPGRTNWSLRDMNNRYRHGTRILYGDCDPMDVSDIPTNPPGKAGLLLPLEEVGPDAWRETVDILLEPPSDTEGAHTAKARYSEQWCNSLIEATANLGVLMRRLAAGFLRTQVEGRPSCAALAPFEWTPLDRAESG